MAQHRLGKGRIVVFLKRACLSAAALLGLGGWALDVDKPVFGDGDFVEPAGLSGVFVPVDRALRYDPISYIYRFRPQGGGRYEVDFINGETSEELTLEMGAVPLGGHAYALQFNAATRPFPLDPSKRRYGFTIISFRCGSIEELWLADLEAEAADRRLKMAQELDLNMLGHASIAADQPKEKVVAMLRRLAQSPDLFRFNDVYVAGGYGPDGAVSVSEDAAIGCADV
ncbi:MAG: hypothetical protein AAGH48_02535 [Pseudomonadota bacterium]